MYDSLWSANLSCCYKSEVVNFSDFEMKVKETHKILLFWLVANIGLPLKGNAIVASKIWNIYFNWLTKEAWAYICEIMTVQKEVGKGFVGASHVT